MDILTTSTAVALVRKNLEELDPNGSIMYFDENGSASAYGDNKSLDDIIKRNLPEAINAIHLAAPVQLLEGVEHVFSSRDDVAINVEGVMTIDLGTNKNFLRLVSLQAADSGIVVTDVLSEASAEGRKQLNKYIRGRADRPRVVLKHASHDAPILFYYTLSDPSQFIETDTAAEDYGQVLPAMPEQPAEDYHWWPTALTQLSYIQEQFYDASTTEYPIARMVRQSIIDYLTAMVLETYSDQRAQTYYTKAQAF